MEIELPDGTVLEAPDDADPSVVAKAYLAKQARPYDPMNDPPRLPGEPGYNDPNSRPLSEAYDTFGKRAKRYGRDVKAAVAEVDRTRTGIPAIDLLGSADVLGSMLRGSVAAPVGAMVGVANGGSPEEEARIAEEFVREYSTPFTESGRAQLGLLGAAASPLSESGADVALLPLAGQRMRVAPSAPKSKPAPIPTTQELGAAKQALYAQAEQAGVVIKPEATARSAVIFRQVAEKENLGRLPPKLSEAVSILDERVAANRPLTLSDADKVRQLINDALKSNDASDRRLAKIIKTRYDGYIDSLGPQDTLAGDASQAVAFLKAARDTNRRFENSRLLDATEKKAARAGDAKFTQAGEEHALRTEFKSLAGNERKMRGLTPEQREAIEAVSRGGSTPGRRFAANAARNVGKFDPTTGGMASLVSLGTGSLAAGMTGNPIGLALPAAGILGRQIATRMTRGNVGRAREALVGRGAPPSAEELGASLREAGMVSQPLEGELRNVRRPRAEPEPRGLLADEPVPSHGLLGPATRSADEIREALRKLDAKFQRLPIDEPDDSPRIRALAAEWERLRAELARAESQGAAP